MNGSVAPARRAAFDLLLELRQKPQSHSDALLRSKRVDALSPADRNLTTTLVMGVLRWQAVLDARIASFLTKKQQQLTAPVEVALEIGALQLLVLDRIPAHAAVSESVELTKQSGNARAAGLVNAVLRKLAGGPKISAADPLGSAVAGSAKEIANRYAHPLWMVERWVRAYGAESASAICRFDQCPPPAAVRLMDPHAEAQLEVEGIGLATGLFVKQARRVLSGDVTATKAFAQGMLRIQDEGSQLVAELAASGAGLPRTILDCCAAPGGKTAILAERNPGASIAACDIRPARLKAMRMLLQNRGLTSRIAFHQMDAAEMRFESEFDLVLCDVPCSGTGTLARNPEIRHRIAPAEFLRQQERQAKILTAAMNAVTPGGHLVYSTCSLEREENERVVRRALKQRQDFRLISCRERVRHLEGEGILCPGSTEALFLKPSSGDFLQTIPGVHACDGFFAAILARVP